MPRSHSTLLQRLLWRYVGLSLLRNTHPVLRYLDAFPDNGLGFALHRSFADLRGRKFIQAGANDGARNDPIAPFIRSLGWQGTLIEPRHFFADLLRQRYADYPAVTVLQAAVAERRTSTLLYSIAPDAPNLPDFAGGLGTLDRTRIEQACRDIKVALEFIREETVDCVPWSEVGTPFPIAEVEILVIDTEGFDIPLLRLWDWGKARPRVVHYEHACAPPAEQIGMLQILREQHYEIVVERDNTTAFLPRR